MYDFSSLKENIEEIRSWLKKEFSGLRSGRASPLMLEDMPVLVYGVETPMKHVASLSVENARTLRVSPWDKGHVKAIQTAIDRANLGLSTAADEDGVRVAYPELTSESRAQLMKSAKERLERSRVALRKERDRVWHEIQEKEKEGGMGEDEKFRAKDELQRRIDEAGRALDEMLAKKNEELNG